MQVVQMSGVKKDFFPFFVAVVDQSPDSIKIIPLNTTRKPLNNSSSNPMLSLLVDDGLLDFVVVLTGSIKDFFSDLLVLLISEKIANGSLTKAFKIDNRSPLQEFEDSLGIERLKTLSEEEKLKQATLILQRMIVEKDIEKLQNDKEL